MAWIESHQGLERHPKTVHLMTLMGWGLDETVGKLHRFWWWCVDYCEDGNLDGINDAQLGFAVGIQGAKETKAFVTAMVAACWLDRSPGTFQVHNWWKYIGHFVQVKYKAKPERWQCIRERYIPSKGGAAAAQGPLIPPSRDNAVDVRLPIGESNGCNNPPNNGCKGGSKGGSSESIPKPLPLNYKEGGKGTIPRATPPSETATAGQAPEKNPPVFASQGGEKQDGHRTTEAGRQMPVGKPADCVQTGPRKFVNEIMKQLKELRRLQVQMQNQYPDYAKMPADKKTEYQRIKSKIRELEKELTAA